MAWKALLVLVALVVACGDSSNGSGGAAASRGAAGAGGEGGSAGAGGSGGLGGSAGLGGAGGEALGFGDLVECEEVYYPDAGCAGCSQFALEAHVPTQGLLLVTLCDSYQIHLDPGVQYRNFEPGCRTFTPEPDEDALLRLTCQLAFVSDDGLLSWVEGWERIYVQYE
jgi:hypothetical protein